MLQKETSDEQVKVEKKSIYFRWLVVFWTLMLVWLIVAVEGSYYEMAYLVDFSSFLLLGVQLLILNVLLLRLIKQVVERTNNELEREKNFLICTLIVFSISYLLSSIKGVLLYYLVAREKDEWTNWFCNSTTHLSIFNLIFYLIVEWMPFMIVFILNFKNFNAIIEVKRNA